MFSVAPRIASRSVRIAPDEDLHYTSENGKVQWIILRGTPIGMSSFIQHSVEELFPERQSSSPIDGLKMDVRTTHLRTRCLLEGEVDSAWAQSGLHRNRLEDGG